MKKQYIVKDFYTQLYYCEMLGWVTEQYLADYFDDMEDAENLIKKLRGRFQIEVVYLV